MDEFSVDACERLHCVVHVFVFRLAFQYTLPRTQSNTKRCKRTGLKKIKWYAHKTSKCRWETEKWKNKFDTISSVQPFVRPFVLWPTAESPTNKSNSMNLICPFWCACVLIIICWLIGWCCCSILKFGWNNHINIDSLQLVDVCVRARVHVRVVLAHTEFDNIVD